MTRKLLYAAGIGLAVWAWSYVLPSSFHLFLSFASVTFNEIVGKFQ